MISRNERHSPFALYRINDRTNTRIDRFHGLDGSIQIACMAHHVAISEVHDVDIRLIVVDRSHERFCNFRLAHFWLKVIGGHLRRRDERAGLERFRLFYPAIEEEGHMRILLRFCDVVLTKPFFSKHIGKHVIGTDLRKRDRCGNGGVVFGETDEFRLFPARTSERIKCGVAKRARDLASTIRTKIEEDERILRTRCFARQADRNDEFVGHVCCIRIFHDLLRTALSRVLTQPNCTPSLLNAIPAIVAIHRIIAT